MPAVLLQDEEESLRVCALCGNCALALGVNGACGIMLLGIGEQHVHRNESSHAIC
jgi:hypothetical protein